MPAALPDIPAAAAEQQWLTLAQCAGELQVAVEVVRGWCVDYEHGKPGLPSSHYGSKTASEARRLNRRVRRDDWEAFKAARRERQSAERREQRREERAAAKVLAAVPFDYVGRRRGRQVAGG